MVLISIAMIIGLSAGSGPVLAQPTGATVEFDPTPRTLDSGCIGFVDVLVNYPSGGGGLGGYNITVSYVQSIIEVIGVKGGDLPFTGDPIANIDNASGQVRVAALQASQLPGPNGDIRIARVYLRALGPSGTNSALSFVTADMTDAVSGATAPAAGTNGNVDITGGVTCATVSGDTDLQFRPNNTGGRALVEISCPVSMIIADVVPADDGTWQIPGVPAETCDLTAAAPGYLTAQGQITVGNTDEAVLPNQLLGGDANKDGVVALNDITGIIAQFTQPSVDCEIGGMVFDVNCDGVVALNDITGAITNFAKSSPQPF